MNTIETYLAGEQPSVNDKELAKAIGMVITSEQKTIQLYQMIADNTESNEVSEMLQEIADDSRVNVSEMQTLLFKIDPTQ